MSIVTSIENGICRIGFNRPDKKNAITAAMYQTMADALVQGSKDDAVKVFLIHGTDDCFTAGNDLQDFLMNPPQGDASPVFQFLHAVSTAEKPLVAAVSGRAVGIGTTLLMHCDMVYASAQSKFSMPFAQLGLCPEAASSYLFPAIAGYQRAAEALLLGEFFGASQAQEMGLVNRVLEADQVMAYALGQCAKLAALPSASLRTTKMLMKKGYASVIAERMAEEGGHFKALLNAPEAKAAFKAFLQKAA
jgi:enoyl-CoA hydratase/carnithine racemase